MENKEINKPLIIIGGSGHGCVIEACVNDNRRRFNDFEWEIIHLVGKPHVTARLFESIHIPDEKWATIIHKTAFVDSSVQLEPGVFIMYNAYIAPRTKIGKCTMIKSNTNIGHDVIIGAVSHVAMGSIIVSCSELGYCSMVAVGATALAHTRIGNYAILGAGSLLTKNIPDDEIFVGSPAKFLKNISEEV